MKIYDCFMFFDEDMLLDLRLNIMDKYVDKFVITEANYMHSGRPKKLNFDINKFSKYKDKIIYKVVDKQPANIIPLNNNDDEITKEIKLINQLKESKVPLMIFELNTHHLQDYFIPGFKFTPKGGLEDVKASRNEYFTKFSLSYYLLHLDEY